MDTPRVFVTNAAGHDYSGAEAYGEIIPITKGYVSFGSLDRVKYHICEGMKNTHEEDWLLLSGGTVITAIAVAAWYQKHKKVKLLIFDRKAKKSRFRELILSPHNFEHIWSLVNA